MATRNDRSYTLGENTYAANPAAGSEGGYGSQGGSDSSQYIGTPARTTPAAAPTATPGDMSGIDWNRIFGVPNMQFGMGGGYPGAMGTGNGYTPHSQLGFFQNWDNWRRQMMQQNFYLPALQATNFGY